MRLVLDTDVIVAALRSPTGASAALLRLIDAGHATMLLSVSLLFEYEAICMRMDHRNAAGLTVGQVDAFLDALVALSEPVEVPYLWRPQLRDPGDEMVLETAVNGRASHLITFNTRDFKAAPNRFGISVLPPGEALRRLRQ